MSDSPEDKPTDPALPASEPDDLDARVAKARAHIAVARETRAAVGVPLTLEEEMRIMEHEGVTAAALA
jgi:hypothetical protein